MNNYLNILFFEHFKGLFLGAFFGFCAFKNTKK
jgi:hypothetical protein